MPVQPRQVERDGRWQGQIRTGAAAARPAFTAQSLRAMAGEQPGAEQADSHRHCLAERSKRTQIEKIRMQIVTQH